MTFFLPTDQAGKVAIGADARIVLDALPGLPIPAKVSFVSPTAQFTPKEVETRTEREKLMFRVKVKVDPQLLKHYAERVKTGLPGKGLCADRGDGGMAGNAEDTGAARVAAAVTDGLAMSLERADAAPVSPVANLTGLGHHYGETVALEAVDLAVPSGCMVGFFGPDGVGKSTLLAIIAGVRQIQKGTVNVLGGDMARVAHRRAV
jgi:ABC-type glutathione transport system ATPase component